MNKIKFKKQWYSKNYEMKEIVLKCNASFVCNDYHYSFSNPAELLLYIGNTFIGKTDVNEVEEVH